MTAMRAMTMMGLMQVIRSMRAAVATFFRPGPQQQGRIGQALILAAILLIALGAVLPHWLVEPPYWLTHPLMPFVDAWNGLVDGCSVVSKRAFIFFRDGWNWVVGDGIGFMRPFAEPNPSVGEPSWGCLYGLIHPLAHPDPAKVPSQGLIGATAPTFDGVFSWLKNDLGLINVTRWFSDRVKWLLDTTAYILYGKGRGAQHWALSWMAFAAVAYGVAAQVHSPRAGWLAVCGLLVLGALVSVIPGMRAGLSFFELNAIWGTLLPIPWIVFAGTAALIGWYLGGWRLALLAGGTFVWCALVGQWKEAMQTMSVILVAAPFAVILGLLLGIAAWRYKSVENALNPFLNLAQSLPHFTYMIPVVVFIGVGPKAGAIVTIIFATPPMVRMAVLGLKRVSPAIIESGQMSGATAQQLLFQVRIPSAREDLLIGVNQTIMQSLAMVVLAALIGMPGLGDKLLQQLGGLKIGRAAEIGLSIVLIAITLDRLSKAWAVRQPIHFARGASWVHRNSFLLISLTVIAALYVWAQYWEPLQTIKFRNSFTMSSELNGLVDVLRDAIREPAQAFKDFMIIYVLVPVRDAFRWVPYAGVLLLTFGVGWSIGGLRSALLSLAFMGFIAISGWWDRAMITLYLVFFSVLLAAIVGLPLGIWAAQSEPRARVVLTALDSAQTFPSFVYLLPAIMLFNVSDVAVILAILIFALVPIARYTIEGLRSVPEAQKEAADMAGATRFQKLFSVEFPLALPTMMVGVNQCVLFSLFMVVIASYIGTTDLGQEMQRALSGAEFGKGLTLGLCVAFMGLMIDHLVMRWAADRKRKLGLD